MSTIHEDDAAGHLPAEHSLRLAIAQLSATLESTTDGILVTDLDKRVLRYNQRFREMWRLSPELIAAGIHASTGHLLAQLKDPQGSGAKFDALYEGPLVASHAVIEFLDGRVVERTSLPLFVDGVDTGRVHSFRDVSEHVRDTRMHAALHAISEAAHHTLDLAELFQRIHAIIGELLPARNFFVALYDAGADRLSFPYFVDEFDAAPPPRPLDSGTLAAEVIRHGRAYLVTPDTQDELPEAMRSIVGSESLDWLGVPLVSGENAIGALVVQSYTGAIRYSERDQELLTFVSSQVASAIERQRAQLARKQQSARIEKLAFYDPLTSLPNRALFLDRLRHALGSADRSNRSVALLFLDLDRFKEINDSLGHALGDMALVEVARRLQATTRQEETLARLGGDEFVLVAEGADLEHAAMIALRMLRLLVEPIAAAGNLLSIGGSIGIALYPADGESADELIRHTDIAMYRAKSSGGGFCFYAPEMGLLLEKRIRMTARLGAAIEAGQLELHYQPLVSLDTGKLRGAEALVRWYDSELGWVSPGEFIPIAEERGMMGRLGDWVLGAACRRLAEWKRAGLELPGRLSVNVSVKQLQDHDLAARLQAIVQDHGLTPDCFELEITESSMMADPEGALLIMEQLGAAGFALAIDDFGTGYSSLSYLKRFTVDQIKIDISFVRDMLSDKDDYAIVKAIIAMADSLGLKTTAEGVEHPEQALALAELGCHFVQGFNFGRPVAPAEFADRWLQVASPELE
ncbi:MAG: EAL domain-containing protein [Arenimonas sp.]